MATVLQIEENEDGSAQVTFELSTDEVQLLLQDAITRAVQNYVLFESSKEIGD